MEGRASYYRLGKKRWRSGILSRYSRFALNIKAMPAMLAMVRPTTAVLAFQLLGWAYQPPAGDQTCLGYLEGLSIRRFRSIGRAYVRDLCSSAHCVCACADSWGWRLWSSAEVAVAWRGAHGHPSLAEILSPRSSLDENTRRANCCCCRRLRLPSFFCCLVLHCGLHEADPPFKMRLAIAGPAPPTSALVPICRGEEFTERHYTT